MGELGEDKGGKGDIYNIFDKKEFLKVLKRNKVV